MIIKPIKGDTKEKYLNKIKVKINLNEKSINEILINFLSFT